MYNRAFQDGTPFQLAIYSLMIPIYIAISFTHLLLKQNVPLVARFSIIALMGSICLPIEDGILLSVPFLAAAIGISGTARIDRSISIVGATLAGIVSLAKFSLLPLSILCLLATDLSDLRRKRFPLHLATLGFALCASFIGSGQDKSQIIPFILSSLEVSNGYSSAMSIPGPILDLLAYLGATILLFALLFHALYKSSSPHNEIDKLLVIFIFFAFLFIGFKAGFVRHDLHSIIAWNLLTIALLTFAATRVDKKLLTVSLLMAAASIFPPQIEFSRATKQPMFSNVPELVLGARAQFSLLKTFLVEPQQWLTNLQSSQATAKAQLGASSWLRKYHGTMDIIPSAQSLIIAAGANYRPRPTIQEYTTYNATLIERNRAYFESNKAPDYLVIAPGSIDHRHPASAEGSLWPLFFTQYEPVEEQPEGIVLAKRIIPIGKIESEAVSIEGVVGQQIEVPEFDAPLMMAVQIKPLLLGKILDILYRPPLTRLSVTYDDGTTMSYRLIPEMAKAGFLLSPLVNSPADYLLVSTGQTKNPTLRHARSVKITMGWGHQLAYDEKIQLDFTKLDAAKLSASNRNAFIDRLFGKGNGLTPLRQESVLREPSLRIVPAGNPPVFNGVPS